jgi:hypothetical protein
VEARGYARAGDEDAMGRRAAKLVGRHRWRRDLLEAAYRDALALEPEPAPPGPGTAEPPAAEEAAPIPAPEADEPEDMVFGDGPPPADVHPPRPALRPVAESLIDPGAGWSGLRPQRPRPGAQNGAGHALPGLFATQENG